MTDNTTPTPTKRVWFLMWCAVTDCRGHYHRPLNNPTEGTWSCTICDSSITRTELAATNRFDDMFNTEDGLLCRGVHPDTTYTYSTPAYPDCPDKTVSADEVCTYLTGRSWSWRAICCTLGEANTQGTATHSPGFGPRAALTRNIP